MSQFSPNKMIIVQTLLYTCDNFILPSSFPAVAAYEATACNQSYCQQEGYDDVID